MASLLIGVVLDFDISTITLNIQTPIKLEKQSSHLSETESTGEGKKHFKWHGMTRTLLLSKKTYPAKAQT